MDAVTKETREYSAKVVFLCASTLNSTWLLMRSATDVWPGGLGSSSGELGHNLMDHHFRLGADGFVDEHQDKTVFGRRPTGFYIPRFRNLFGDKREYLRGFGYQGSASRQGWERAIADLGVGAAFKDQMATPGPWRMGATAFGEDAAEPREPRSRSIRRKPTSGACRCLPSTAPSARTNS
jgi:choline dehydrogenase-like flavoprotein